MSATSKRVGRRQLDRIQRDLSSRDLAIIASVAEHRFLTTRQIEVLHFYEHGSALAGARACRRVLARLHRVGALDRLQRRVGGIRAGSASTIWLCTSVGDRLLSSSGADGIRRRKHEPSTTFLDHTLAIGDVHVALVLADRTGTLKLVSVELEPDCWRRSLGSGGGVEVLRPDLFVVTAAGEAEECVFVEVDLATESLPTILRKCQQYEKYRRTGHEQQQGGSFPRVLWLVPSETRRDKLADAITGLRDVPNEMFDVELIANAVAAVPDGASS